VLYSTNRPVYKPEMEEKQSVTDLESQFEL